MLILVLVLVLLNIRIGVQLFMMILTLVVMTAFPGTLLLLTSAIEATAEKLLEKAPSLVVRQVSSQGWRCLQMYAQSG